MRIASIFEDFSIYVHQQYCPIVFFLCCVFIWFWNQDDAGLIKRARESSLFLDFLEQFEKDRGQFFHKCFVKFCYETVQSRAFVCQEFIDYCLNFSICYQSVQVFCLFLFQFWKLIFFQKFVCFTQVFKFFGMQLFIVISYNPLYFCGVSYNLSSFISDFVYLGPLSLSLSFFFFFT